MAERVYQRGEIVYREGDKGDCFYRILSGSVEVTVDAGQSSPKKLTTLGAGDFFGEMAVMAGRERSGTVTVQEDGTRLLELSAANLSDSFSEQPQIALDLIRLLGGRIRALSADYEAACATLSEIKAAVAKPRQQTLFDKARMILTYLSGGKKSYNRPSEEARKTSQDHTRENPVASYKAGTVLYRQGEPGKCMYRIHYGRVGVYAAYGTDDELKLTELAANQFFGELGVLDGEPRSATVVVLDDNTTLEAIYPEDLEALFRRNPSEIAMILEHTSGRLRKLTEDYTKVCREISELQ